MVRAEIWGALSADFAFALAEIDPGAARQGYGAASGNGDRGHVRSGLERPGIGREVLEAPDAGILGMTADGSDRRGEIIRALFVNVVGIKLRIVVENDQRPGSANE